MQTPTRRPVTQTPPRIVRPTPRSAFRPLRRTPRSPGSPRSVRQSPSPPPIIPRQIFRPIENGPMPDTTLVPPNSRVERCMLRNPPGATSLSYIGPLNGPRIKIEMFDIVEYDADICQVIDINVPHITIVAIATQQHQTINMTQYVESEGKYRSAGYGVRFDERRETSAFDLPDLQLNYLPNLSLRYV